MEKEDRDTLWEALNWTPKCGERERPEKLWRRLMEEPYKKEANNDKLTSKEV